LTRSVQAERWCLTLVRRDCSCNKCAPHLRRGSEIAPPHAAVGALRGMRRARGIRAALVGEVGAAQGGAADGEPGAAWMRDAA
jgi:hypothetical protein